MLPFTTLRFVPASLATILTVCGCSPPIDRPAITNTIRTTDLQVMKFLDVFPNADLSVETIQVFRGLRDPLNQNVRVRNELKNGHAVMMSRSLRVDPDGVTFDCFESQSWQYYLVVPGVREISLGEERFNALLAAGGDMGSLKPHGMDFSLAPMNVEKVIDEVRELFPPAGKLHEVFPDAWAQVNKSTFTQRGQFTAVANLADGDQLSVRREIRVAADGIGVELVGESTPTSLYVPSAGPGGQSVDLTPEQFDRILAAKGAPAVVQQVWSQRPRSEGKPKPLDVPKDSEGRKEDKMSVHP